MEELHAIPRLKMQSEEHQAGPVLPKQAQRHFCVMCGDHLNRHIPEDLRHEISEMLLIVDDKHRESGLRFEGYNHHGLTADAERFRYNSISSFDQPAKIRQELNVAPYPDSRQCGRFLLNRVSQCIFLAIPATIASSQKGSCPQAELHY
jgi:hypothetical protein